jgi:formylglycine-generating enzyme required for sulfatase activity
MRGGSWLAGPDFVRCANRYGLRPGDRESLDGGFRVVLE